MSVTFWCPEAKMLRRKECELEYDCEFCRQADRGDCTAGNEPEKCPHMWRSEAPSVNMSASSAAMLLVVSGLRRPEEKVECECGVWEVVQLPKVWAQLKLTVKSRTRVLRRPRIELGRPGKCRLVVCEKTPEMVQQQLQSMLYLVEWAHEHRQVVSWG